MDNEGIAERVMAAMQLASILEVSGYPKPGNVHRTADFPDTRYEHFLAGSIALGPAAKKAALRGAMVAKGEIQPSDIGVGECIKEAVEDVRRSHAGGNTHLGTIFLLIPLAAAAGKTLAEGGKIDSTRLRKNFTLVMKSTTSVDSIHTYDAIETILERGGVSWLGRVGASVPDLSVSGARDRLSKEDISLYDWMKISSRWDSIAKELTSGMRISFGIGYRTLKKTLEEHGDINVAIVHTFLKILSEIPDTLVARKVGLRTSPNVAKAVRIGIRRTKWISGAAKSILAAGGLTTKKGREALYDLDRKLHSAHGELNPGTTADLTAASLAIGILCGLKF